MKITTSTHTYEKVRSEGMIVGVFSDAPLAGWAQALNEAHEGIIDTLKKDKTFLAKLGETLVLRHLPEMRTKEVVLVGLGASADFNEEEVFEAFTAAMKAARAKTVSINISEWVSGTRSVAWSVMQMAIRAMTLEEPVKEAFVNEKNNRKLTFCVERKDNAITDALALAQATAEGINHAKWLANMPPNACTPAFLAKTAQSYEKIDHVKVRVHDKKAIEKIGMNALLAVSQGSRVPPAFIEMHYQGTDKDEAPICLIGKGITFDAGGICLKPASSIADMKFDMSGAAAVMATFRAAATMQLPINLVALVPACENLPDGHAVKPSDVIQTLSGLTVEVANTDAEGRLILADALTYAQRFEPQSIVDVATLTGACVVALGDTFTGLFVNDPVLYDAIQTASDVSMDAVWLLPYNGRYKKGLKSPVADLSNIGPRGKAGASVAATFLANFVSDDTAWAHLDIAGTANTDGSMGVATGRPVALLLTWLHLTAFDKE